MYYVLVPLLILGQIIIKCLIYNKKILHNKHLSTKKRSVRMPYTSIGSL